MPHRDDLIGLLRSLDAAMKEAEPRAGHEARMRARLASVSGERRPVKTIALAFCAIAAGAATWIAWSSSRSPDPSALPLGAPSASGEVVAEPHASPSSSARPSRPSPRRSVPALPILPPHGELAPPPDRRAPDAVPPDVQRADAPSRGAFDRSSPASAGVEDPSVSPSIPRGTKTSAAIAWGASGTSAGAPSRSNAVTSLGAITGEPRASGASSPGSSHGSSSGANDTSHEQPVSKPDPDAAPCETQLLDFGGKCVSATDLKDIAFDLCGATGRTLSGLDSIVPCGASDVGAAKVTCCSPDTAPSEPDPYFACKPISAGDGVMCLDVSVLVEQASSTCASWGMTFEKPAPSGLCSAGSATWLDALCCPGAPVANQAPPSGVVGDGASCTPDDKLLVVANDLCLSQGLSLVDFFAAEDCDGDASTTAKYVCGK